MSAITAKASRKMKKYAVLTREPRCFLGSFDFSWEQRNFADVVQIERGGSPRPIDDYITDSQNGLNWVKIGDAPAQGHYITKTAEKIRPEGLSKTREVHPGDLILSNSMSFGKPYIMGIDGCIHDGWLLIRDTNSTFDLTFLCHLLGTPQMLDQYRSLAAGSTVNNLNKELVGNTVVTIPTIDEQRVLGQYLERLDNLITLHQRKCANLCSPSQVVFSLLFATSTFSWEQRKLGDIADIVGGGTPSTGNQSYWDGDIDWYAPAEIADQIYANSSQKKITGLGYENSSAKMLPPGTVLFTSRAGIGKTAILTRKGCTNQGFQSIVPHRGELDSYFIFSRTEELKRYGELVGAGSTFVEVSGKQMAVMELMMPPTMREQQTIGGFFQQLDHLITLHQRECISFTGRADRLILTANKKRTTSSWEQRKLTEFVEFFSGLTYTPNDVQENGTLVLRSSNVSNGEVVDADNIYVNPQVVNSENVKVGDIVVVVRNGSRSLIGKHAQIKAFMPNTVIGAFMTGIRSECPEFTNALLNTSRFEEEIAMNMGATINQITGYMFSKMEFKVPCLDEQKKIGEYFEKLDNLITLHQRKPFLMKWRTSDANRNQTNRLVL